MVFSLSYFLRQVPACTHDSQSVGSELGSGGNLQLLAGRDLGTTAAYLNASGAIGLGAGRDLRLLAGENSASARDERYVASMARGKSDGNDVIWRNSQLDAGNTLTLARTALQEPAAPRPAWC